MKLSSENLKPIRGEYISLSNWHDQVSIDFVLAYIFANIIWKEGLAVGIVRQIIDTRWTYFPSVIEELRTLRRSKVDI